MSHHFRMKDLIGRFRRDRRGVSAVEFALIAPLLITMFFGLGELGQALMAQRRVSHIASTIGDLTAQSTAVNSTSMNDDLTVAQIMIKPFSSSTLGMRITSVTADANQITKVDWSQSPGSTMTPLATGSTVTLPTGLISAAGDSVIMSETTYTFVSPVGIVLPHGLSFSEKFYFRPRKTATVTFTTSGS